MNIKNNKTPCNQQKVSTDCIICDAKFPCLAKLEKHKESNKHKNKYNNINKDNKQDNKETDNKQLQEELRAFIEQFEHKVRFIATANNVSKIIDAMHSRFNIIDFTPKNQDEIKQIKVEFAKRLINLADVE